MVVVAAAVILVVLTGVMKQRRNGEGSDEAFMVR